MGDRREQGRIAENCEEPPTVAPKTASQWGAGLIALDRAGQRRSAFYLVSIGAYVCLEVVGWPGLEPGTNGLKGRCSTD